MSTCDPLVHVGILLRRSFHLEKLDERLDGDALDEARPEDDGDCGGDEHVLLLHHRLAVELRHEGEGDGPAKPAVCHHKLVDRLEFVQPVLVGEGREKYDANDPAESHPIFVIRSSVFHSPEDGAEEDGQEYKRPVPNLFVADGRNSQEDEHDHLHHVGQHLDHVLESEPGALQT